MDDNTNLLARLLMGQGHGPSPMDRMLNETIIPRQPGPEDNVRALLGSPNNMAGTLMPDLGMSMGDRFMSAGTPAGGASLAANLLGPGRRPNTYGAISDLRRSSGAQGSNPAQQAFDASMAETDRVLGVIRDALGPGPRPAPSNPPPSTDDVIRAIQEALAIRNR